MPFFTAQHIEIALGYLGENTYPTLMGFLSMLYHQVPRHGMGPGVQFRAAQDRAFLLAFFAPAGANAAYPYYSPFGTSPAGATRWRKPKTVGSNLPRQRNEKEYMFPREGDGPNAVRWLAADPDEVLADHHEEIVGTRPISLHHLAAWCLRDKEVASHEEAIARMVDLLHLGDYGLVPGSFATSLDPGLSAIPLGHVTVGGGIAAIIGLPPGPGAVPAVAAGELVEDGDEDEDEDAGGEEPLPAAPAPMGTWIFAPGRLEQSVGHLRGIEEAVIQAAAALRAGMHVVFTGPPGCGKTDLAQRLCEAGDFETWQVTATNQWGTFETIGGYFPDPDEGGQVLDYLPGVVVSAIRQSRILIIDEVNRADIDKAFGELFTLLSGHPVDLPYTERVRGGAGERRRIRLAMGEAPTPEGTEVIRVPRNWRLIAAMNDADKASLKRLSYAFVRRFAFVPVPIPEQADYEQLIRGATTATIFLDGNGDDGEAGPHRGFREALLRLFADPAGLASIGMPMGFAIPKAMATHAIAEAALPGRTTPQVVRSALELYLVPQFQGRADLHEGLLNLVGPLIHGEDARFARTLATWTGYRPR